MLRNISLVVVFLTLAAGIARADQIYVGATLNSEPGEPDFKESRPAVIGAYEAQAAWRFSFTSGRYKHENKNFDQTLDTQIIGVERMWVYEMGRNLLLIGAFGPGMFSAEVDTGSQKKTGKAVGVLATASFRAYFGKGFLDLAYHYRNAAVDVDHATVNAGYSGPVIGVGLAF